jgi:molecular chaperone DnaK
MVKEAEANADADKVRRGFVEAKNRADSLTHQVEQSLAQHGNAIAPADQADGRSALDAVKVAIEAGVEASLVQATERLAEVAARIAVATAQDPSSTTNETSAGPSNEHAVDAEFEDVSPGSGR